MSSTVPIFEDVGLELTKYCRKNEIHKVNVVSWAVREYIRKHANRRKR